MNFGEAMRVAREEQGMDFDTWMRARNPKYRPTDDTVALRELRECWRAASLFSDRAQERELMIELMRDKCRKVGAGSTANLPHNAALNRTDKV